jgi:hypothetical protein
MYYYSEIFGRDLSLDDPLWIMPRGLEYCIFVYLEYKCIYFLEETTIFYIIYMKSDDFSYFDFLMTLFHMEYHNMLYYFEK